MSDNMRREFKSRDQMVAYLCEQFPAAARRDDQRDGGRTAAERN